MDDQAKFDGLHGHYAPYVEAFVRRRCDAAVVDDVVSEVFATAWRRIGDIPGDALPWLYRTARNVVGTRYRTDKRWSLLATKIANVPGERFGADPAEIATERNHVVEALHALSEPDREVILLTAWEGLSQHEVAEVIGIEPATVGVRLHRARKRLRAAMSDSATERSTNDG